MQSTAIWLFNLCPSSMLAARNHLEPSYPSVLSCSPEMRLVLQTGSVTSVLYYYLFLCIYRYLDVQKSLYVSAFFFSSVTVLSERLAHLTDSEGMVSQSEFQREEHNSLPLTKYGSLSQ